MGSRPPVSRAPVSPRCPHLHGECSTPSQVRATWRSVCRRDGSDLAPDRSLSTTASAQANRPVRRLCTSPAVLVLRWFLDGTRLAQLACDNRIGRSTAYRYLHEGIDALAVAAPGLRGALLAARAAGHSHVTVDGTLIRTDRCSVAGPTARADRSEQRVDLWWSGKHACHGGNVQVIAAPDGWPIWTSGVRPGREHDTTAPRAHPEALPLLTEWTDDH